MNPHKCPLTRLQNRVPRFNSGRGLHSQIPATVFALYFLTLFANCSGTEFGQSREKAGPNTYPVSYKSDLLAYLRVHPGDMERAREAHMAPPALTQFGSESRYVVCLRVMGENWRAEKMAVYFAGEIIYFLDPKGQCDAAAYQPFPELLGMFGQMGAKQ
jgi:hypothetical protein